MVVPRLPRQSRRGAGRRDGRAGAQRARRRLRHRRAPRAPRAGACRDATLIGIDIDAGAAAVARDKSGARSASARSTALPFADGRFDAIFSADVLCHRGVDERAALAEFRRCLRPGGVARAQSAGLSLAAIPRMTPPSTMRGATAAAALHDLLARRRLHRHPTPATGTVSSSPHGAPAQAVARRRGRPAQRRGASSGAGRARSSAPSRRSRRRLLRAAASAALRRLDPGNRGEAMTNPRSGAQHRHPRL